MATTTLNIDASAVVVFTNNLEKLHRSALPVAVRTALNSAAQDMKGITIDNESAKAFVRRRPKFFSALSKIDYAKGFDIDKMQSMVGFTGKSQAVENLEKQEEGGDIGGRAFWPTLWARTSNAANKPVRANARMSRIKVVNTANVSGKNEKERFVKSVLHAGKDGHVLSEWNGKSFLWRVNSIDRTKTGQFKLTPIFSYEKGRKIKVDATNFMSKAQEDSASRIEKYFIEAAEKQIQKAMSK
jgi:hypothetical protein